MDLVPRNLKLEKNKSQIVISSLTVKGFMSSLKPDRKITKLVINMDNSFKSTLIFLQHNLENHIHMKQNMELQVY